MYHTHHKFGFIRDHKGKHIINTVYIKLSHISYSLEGLVIFITGKRLVAEYGEHVEPAVECAVELAVSASCSSPAQHREGSWMRQDYAQPPDPP